MRIQHNIMAMNAYRNYNNNTSALSKNLEKLSSGYKINRAGDDAAGLAISEKMRAQITGLKAASKNVKDGVSLVKTAEGALQEVHDMLNRMDSLATQSANGTYDNEVDRLNLQKEVTALQSEIDRIADSSNFNGKALLDGSLSGTKASGVTYAANSIKNIEVTGGKVTGAVTDAFQAALTENGELSITGPQAGVDGLTWKLKGDAAGAATAKTTVGDNGGTYTFEAVVAKDTAKADKAELYEGMTITVTVDGKATEGNNKGKFTKVDATAVKLDKGTGLELQIGDTAKDYNKLSVDVKDMHTKNLGISDVDISTQSGAATAIDKIKTAINTVSSTRGDLGAIQNRLEHTQNNLSVMTENIQDAESTIRDTDVADEMMAYTKNNILVQSAQAMLAQANQVPQGVLQLLQ